MRSLVRSYATALFASILVVPTLQAADPIKADLEECEISFVGSKPDGTEHEGGFKKFEIDAKADMEDPSQSSIRIEIKTDSLWSDDKKLTAHLKNPDFFNVRKYPKIVFESTKIEPTEDSAKITGKLIMLEKEGDLVVPTKVEVTEGGITLSGKFKLDKTKWGMDYGKGKINDDVDVSFKLVFKR